MRKTNKAHAHMILSAIYNHAAAMEHLNKEKPDMQEYHIWKKMRDEKLVELTGLDMQQLVKLAYSK